MELFRELIEQIMKNSLDEEFFPQEVSFQTDFLRGRQLEGNKQFQQTTTSHLQKDPIKWGVVPDWKQEEEQQLRRSVQFLDLERF